MFIVTAVGVVGAVVGIGSAVASHGAAQDQQEAQEVNTAQNTEYNRQKYEIEKQWHDSLQRHAAAMSTYGDRQLGFAIEQRRFAGEVYNVALANAENEMAFREEEVFNKKMSATASYNAQVGVSDLMIQGAADSAANAYKETVRTGSANARELERQAGKAEGAQVAKHMSGITGGASKRRELIAVRMERNRALTQVEEGVKASLFKTTEARNQMVSNNSIKVNESYRNLQAMLKLEAQPVPTVQGPAPVFAAKAPIAPVQPLGPPPMPGVSGTSSYAPVAAGLSGAATGINLGNQLGTIGNAFLGTSPTAATGTFDSVLDLY